MVERKYAAAPYSIAERAWWTSCLLRAALAYASGNEKARQYLEIAPGEEPSEDDVLTFVSWVREEFPITWQKIQGKARDIQLVEVSERARKLLVEKGVDFSESTLEAKRELAIEYENGRPRRHKTLERLETFLFESYDRIVSS